MEADAFAADSNMSTDAAPPYPWSGTLAEVYQPGIKAGLLAETRSLHVPRAAAADDRYVARTQRYIAAQLEASSVKADYPTFTSHV
ncbi:hypothetical protein LAZ67_3005899 [Cordylochernes scorpioides]|uniref:Uncharacterized protein n=1 Tax=Cordylochernes scorpioides TaxID=51811 RepID=A0ABY6KFG3_9ARAC|nr:hypothetical protein LAZ67_3005899 [Cordylochernes scorpioides]